MAELYKDSLLRNTPSPRIIFIGGSNLVFGINGFMIKEELEFNTINTGISAAIGLQHAFKHTLPFIKENDIVILIPEYHHFVRNWNDGSRELLSLCLDINRDNIKYLSIEQIISLLPYMPEYSFRKLQPNQYNEARTESAAFTLHSFDCWGGTRDSLIGKKQDFLVFEVSGNYNESVVDEIKKFEKKVDNKGAKMFISYPAYEKESFKKWCKIINKVQRDIEQNNFQVFGTPERYMMPDSLMFDTPYHCNRKGVEYITNLRIEDIKNSLSVNY
ncbi:MAG: hypothetical protein LBS50_07595 [Prevotellaceae bacterium]|nr:hypothetical protein [Prevotellaceae bacterium]